jgi:hypothetical protein
LSTSEGNTRNQLKDWQCSTIFWSICVLWIIVPFANDLLIKLTKVVPPFVNRLSIKLTNACHKLFKKRHKEEA